MAEPKKDEELEEEEGLGPTKEDLGARAREIEEGLPEEEVEEVIEESPEETRPVEVEATVVHTPAEWPVLSGLDVGDEFTVRITNIDGENYTLTATPTRVEEEIETPVEAPVEEEA